jgi:hypothetical protein
MKGVLYRVGLGVIKGADRRKPGRRLPTNFPAGAGNKSHAITPTPWA